MHLSITVIIPIADLPTLVNSSDPAEHGADLNMPPAILPGNNLIFVDPLPGGSCILNIPYTIPNGSAIVIHEGKQFVIEGDFLLQ